MWELPVAMRKIPHRLGTAKFFEHYHMKVDPNEINQSSKTRIRIID